MKKILIFYPQLDKPLSGGQVIDFEFIKQIKRSGYFSISYFLDKDLSSPSILNYNLYLLSHILAFMKYDVIFMNSRQYPRMLLFVSLLRFLRFKGRIITYHHHYNFETISGWERKVHEILELLFLKKMSGILIPSPFVRDLTRHLLPKANIVYIPIGFSINSDMSLKIKRERETRIVCVGNIERRKRTHHIVEIANILKNSFPVLQYDIVGGELDKAYSEEIKEQISNYNIGLIVKLYGRVDDETLKSLYQKASLFVFPSSYEGYGMVLVEAMSNGLPVVAYNNSAIPYTIKNDYNGVVVEDGNFEKMAEAIGHLLNDTNKMYKLSGQALKYVGALQTIDDMKKMMANYIEELAHS